MMSFKRIAKFLHRTTLFKNSAGVLVSFSEDLPDTATSLDIVAGKDDTNLGTRVKLYKPTAATDVAVRLSVAGVDIATLLKNGVLSALGITAAAGTNTTQIATTAFVKTASDSAIGFKNKIIGADFTVNPWQRGTSFAAIATAAYSADRWRVGFSTTAVVTASKATDAPTATEAGLFTQHCLSLAVTTADAAIAAGEFFIVGQNIEGLNAASFGFGQSGTRNATLSFWVKGTKTGIHCVSLRNSGQDRSYVAEYTINVTNTWEYKTITVAVDTTGTWLYDTGVGLRLNFALACGTTYHTTAGAWAAGDFMATANQVNALDSNTNIFKITLPQLEFGAAATAFDVRSVAQELVLCQRYYELFGHSGVGRATAATTGEMSFGFKTDKRTIPTVALFYTGAPQILEIAVATRTITSLTIAYATTMAAYIEAVVSGGGMTSPNMLSSRSTTDAIGKFLSATAEL